MPMLIIGLTLVTQNVIAFILVLVVVLAVLAWLGGLFTHPKPVPEPTTPENDDTPDMSPVSGNIRNAFKLSGTELRQYAENMRILGIADMIAEDFEHTRRLCTRNASLFARAADECLEETKRIMANAEARQKELSKHFLNWKLYAAQQRATAERCAIILEMLNTPETPTEEPPAPPTSFPPADVSPEPVTEEAASTPEPEPTSPKTVFGIREAETFLSRLGGATQLNCQEHIRQLRAQGVEISLGKEINNALRWHEMILNLLHRAHTDGTEQIDVHEQIIMEARRRITDLDRSLSLWNRQVSATEGNMNHMRRVAAMFLPALAQPDKRPNSSS